MLRQVLVLIGSYLAGEFYKKYVTPEQKSKWENTVKIHHGEAGAIMTYIGILTKSPYLTVAGIGLMLHDRGDFGKWFRNSQNKKIRKVSHPNYAI